MAFETKEIKLPSCGKVGGIETVTIRNMTGADEKVIYSGVSENAIDKLLKRCIVEPQNIAVNELCEQDKYFILMQIRILTFGSIYHFEAKCPECGNKVTVEVDLDDLEIYYANADDFDASLLCELRNGDKIEFKVMTSRDVAEVTNYLARIKASNDKGMQMIARLASVIKSINGEELALIDKQKYLEESNSRDINVIWRAFSKIKLGVNMNAYISCPSCGSTVEVPVEMNTEFFRPSIDD